MITTVVGSYPAKPGGPETLGERLKSFFGSFDEYKSAIRIAVEDQVRAGIDIVSDGQVRGDMVGYFAASIPGMTIKEGVPTVISKINPPKSSIGAYDLKYAIELVKKINNGDGVGVKGIITGPSTMVYASRIDGFYDASKRQKAVIDMARALKVEAMHLEAAGAALIQIDEPFLSTGIVDLGTAKKAVNMIADSLNVEVSMHVCGDLRGVFSELQKFRVDILDFEFAGTRSNLDLLEGHWHGNKKIGFGCVDTKTERVEEVDDIRSLIRRAVDIVGEENIYVDPDCGMRKLSRRAAFSKLRNMVEAAAGFK